MDFVDLEDFDIQQQKQKAEENLFMFGNGLAQLVWDTPDIVKVFVGMVASVSLTASLYVAKSGNAILDSYMWVAAVFVIMMLAGLCNARMRKKEEKVFKKWTEGTVWYNRAFLFFGHELYVNTARAKDVRIYRQERIADREMQKLEEHNQKDDEYIGKMSSYQGTLIFSQGICNSLCYLFVVAKASLGAFAVGNIVLYVGALIELVRNFGNLILAVSENQVYTEHLEKLFEYLDLPNKKYQGKIPIEKSFFCKDGENDYDIEFRNVSFKYPNSDTYVLKNINTRLSIGKKQAFVGKNGSGKTTFVKLLCRLYDPTEGEILLNGIDIRKYDYEEYMQLFSFVFQDFKLFAFSLGQNIAANMNYDIVKAEDCMKRVSFYDRYKSMSEGLDTYLYKDISEKGVEISGGEAQKIALARALYKGTPIIVLDEPTAALDPIAEAQVYSDFSNMVENKTAIYISHRLSSCQFCDEITVFQDGRIVQKGTHVDLSKDKDGKYFELWNAQARYYQNI
jgi:ATP-binding cassette subfamily B protein